MTRRGLKAQSRTSNRGQASICVTAPPKAIHVLQLRTVLGDARINLGLSPLQYTGPTPQALQPFNATDINDLRDGVR